MQPPIAASTGSLLGPGHTTGPLSDATVASLLSAGFDGVELSGDAAGLRSLDAGLLASCRWLSAHAPDHGKARTGGLSPVAAFLDALACLPRIPDCVVVHPPAFWNGRQWDFAFLAPWRHLPLALENMDARKATGRFPEEMAGAFAALDAVLGRPAGLVLDTSHVAEHTPDGSLGRALLGRFGHRLAEVHASGHRSFHEPLSEAGQDHLLALVPAGVPVVAEGGLVSRDAAESEARWLRERLER